MDEQTRVAIEVLKRKVDEAQGQVARWKRAANDLAASEGLPIIYDEIDGPAARAMLVRPDQFAGFSTPSAAARAFLELRGKAVGAAALDDIFEAMKRGGYFFEGNESDSKASLRIALGKDRGFVRLQNGYYGLLAWYPERKREREVDAPETDKKAKKSEPQEAEDEIPF